VECFRIPSIVQTASGALVAFAEARHGSCGDGAVHEIAMRRSIDGGATWSNVTFVAGNESHHVSNPTAVFDSVRLRIVLMFAYVPYISTTGMVVSMDDGQTWTEETLVDVGAANGSLCGPGTAVQSRTGRLLVASHHGAYQYDLVTLSDDGGETWTTVEQRFPAMDEAAITQLPNGTLLLTMRHQQVPALGRGTSMSNDDGLTWSDITYDGRLLGPVCQASAVSFDGATYYSSPTCQPLCNRANLTIFRSTDSTRTWSTSLLVAAPASAGYSCLVRGGLVAHPGTGGILYEASGEGRIAFSRFPTSLARPTDRAGRWQTRRLMGKVRTSAQVSTARARQAAFLQRLGYG